MEEHATEVHLPLRAGEVRALFEARPSGWLRPFLRLAAQLGTGRPASASLRTWFRLGLPVDDERGAASVEFTWLAHLRGGLFESFRGQFVLQTRHDGSIVLRLEGLVIGGEQARNAAVLDALLKALAEALTADQGPIGYSMMPARTAVATASSFE